MMVRLHRFGRFPAYDAALADAEAFCIPSEQVRGYVRKVRRRGRLRVEAVSAYTRGEVNAETVFIVELTERRLIPVLNHEVLHIVLDRLNLDKESHALDRVSNIDEWAVRGNLGGL